MKSQSGKHLWFSRMVFALSLGLLFLPTGCANLSRSAAPSAPSPAAPSPSVPSPSVPSLPAPSPTPTAAGNFTAVGNMTTGRADHTATLLRNGKVLIAGGEGDGFHALASAELYDPSTRTFAPTGSMIMPRYAHSATLLVDGRVLIAGGVNGDTSVFIAEIYDPSTGAFTATGDLTSIGGGIYASPGDVTTLLPDGRVFVAASNNAEIYDPQSGTFTPTGPYANLSDAYGITVTLLTNGKVLVTGCADAYGSCSVGVTELFDPQSGTFGVTGPMMLNYFPDYGYTAALLTDGRVLFLGSGDFAFADAEVYDPAAGTFAFTGSAIENHQIAPASRLTDGTVLIAGGQVPGGDGSAYSELYVPANGTFEFAGWMTASRHSHTATPLPDDTVLITGGFSVWPDPTSSAEVYKPR
jgi:large repetitive protein